MIPDSIGNSLRKFYKTFGMENEGPPEFLNVAELFPFALKKDEINLIDRICSNSETIKQFKICKGLTEDVANLLGNTNFMKEIEESITKCTPAEKEHLTNGIFWHYLAAILDPKLEDKIGFKIPIPGQLPDITEKMLKVQGSLIFRLYISLVYMKEGPLNKLINQTATNNKPISLQCKRLLNCDYVRHLRNALAHSTFESTSFGIYFNDYNKFETVASPEFLNFLTTWIMYLNLQCSTVLDFIKLDDEIIPSNN